MEILEQESSLTQAEIVALLRKHEVSPTQQRIEIARIVLSKHQHLSAEQVLALVNTETAKVSKATVYNTLGLFARQGLVRELVIDPSKVFYDSNVSSHHHFYNVDTGELTDISDHDVDVNMLPSAPDGNLIEGVDVIVRIRQAS